MKTNQRGNYTPPSNEKLDRLEALRREKRRNRRPGRMYTSLREPGQVAPSNLRENQMSTQTQHLTESIRRLQRFGLSESAAREVAQSAAQARANRAQGLPAGGPYDMREVYRDLGLSEAEAAAQTARDEHEAAGPGNYDMVEVYKDLGLTEAEAKAAVEDSHRV